MSRENSEEESFTKAVRILFPTERIDISEEDKKRIQNVRGSFSNLLTISEKERFLESLDYDEVKYILDDDLIEVVKQSSNRRVCEICMENINPLILRTLIRETKLSRETMLKFTLTSNSLVLSELMNNKDVDNVILMQMLRNNKTTFPAGLTDAIINHKNIDEETLYRIAKEIPNDFLLCRILASEKANDRIINYLHKHPNDEIRRMAAARDKKTSATELENILLEEFKKCPRDKDTGIIRETFKNQTLHIVPTDTLEAVLINPTLEITCLKDKPGLFGRSISLRIIQHPKISKEMLEYYISNGVEEICKAAKKRLEQIENSVEGHSDDR